MTASPMTTQQLVEILKRHEKFVRGQAGGIRADMRDQSFASLKLPSLNLRNATLARADFSNCGLVNA